MDTTVRPNLSNKWGVTDLLERPICSIVRDPEDQFWIVMTADELPQMRDVRRGPFAAVEGAMAAIEINLHVPADTAQPSRLLIISPSADRELRRILSCAIGRAT